MVIHYLNILNEGAVDDKIKRYIREYTLNDNKEILDFKVEDLNEDYKNYLQQVEPTLYDSCIRNNLRYLDFCRLYLLKYFDISHNKGPIEYVLGIARIACSELGMFNENYDNSGLMLFKQIVLFIHNNPTELQTSYDKNLNGKTFNELKNEVNNIRREFNQKRREALKNIPKRSIKSDYKVIPITCKEDAYKFAKYTSWCVTRDEHYSSYAKNGSRFYFCLKNGFENVKEIKKEGCPLDEYGLSMISVLIDMDGEPEIITTRWNHAYDGENNENLKTAEQFEQITGIPFYDTFKPYTKEELEKMGVVAFDELENKLNNGEDPFKIFPFATIIDIDDIDQTLIVKANDKYNFVDCKTNKLLSDIWFNRIIYNSSLAGIINDDHLPPIIPIGYKSKCNFFNLKEKHLISDFWFDDFEKQYFSENNIAIISKYDNDSQDNTMKSAIIDINGKLVSEWYDKISSIGDYTISRLFKAVKKDNENIQKYIINIKGEDITNNFRQVNDVILPFKHYKNQNRDYYGAVVKKNNKFNVIDEYGKLLSDKWYNYYNYFYIDNEKNIKWWPDLNSIIGKKMYGIGLYDHIYDMDEYDKLLII